jgi:transcription antitermination protein NusB
VNVNKKRLAREFCFQYFFHMQLPIFQELKFHLAQEADDSVLKNAINDFKETTNSLFDDELNIFIFEQIKSTLKNYQAIESLVEKYLKNWKLHRIARVEHTNLLLAVNDLCFSKSAPASVIINEAIEISKKYGTQDSGAFTNGILDNIARNEI